MPPSLSSPVLVLRSDATSQLGLGHVMRCLALAQAWRSRGGRPVMIAHCPFDDVRRQIRQQGIQLVPLAAPHPAADDVSTTLLTLADLNDRSSPINSPAWVVVDGSHFDGSYLTLLRSTGHKVAAIDDYAQRPFFDADLLVNPNFGAERFHYRTPTGARQMMGLRHAPLRGEFQSWRRIQRPAPVVARKLLVTLGGSDPTHATAAVMRALELIRDTQFEARVVVGPANCNLRALRLQAIDSRVPVRLVTDTLAIPALMGWADLAISAAGVTCWELACVGLPNATLATSAGQLPIIEAIARLGAVVPLGLAQSIQPATLADEIGKLLTDQAKRQSLAQHGQALVDGRGADRVVSAMLSAAGHAVAPETEGSYTFLPEQFHEAA